MAHGLQLGLIVWEDFSSTSTIKYSFVSKEETDDEEVHIIIIIKYILIFRRVMLRSRRVKSM